LTARKGTGVTKEEDRDDRNRTYMPKVVGCVLSQEGEEGFDFK
jgi:hypothetical protein